MLVAIALGLFFSSQTFADTDFNFIELSKRKCRRGVIERSKSIYDKSIILQNDHAQDLVEDPSKMIFSLSEMDNLNLFKKNVSVAPWSDSYWPLFEGALGARYNDPNMHFSNWKDARDYVTKNPAKKLISKKQLDNLSPSEKYDFLLGLDRENLTRSSWSEGEEYFRENGKVETWMGLCHGWAAASMMMVDPVKRVEVKTNAGKLIFYPSDIKGLGTLLWAKGEFQTRFVGGRCNLKGPAVDGMGRPKEGDCLDNNPGTWHLAIVNQIGVFDRSFVMDATYDYQVWNQPVYGYEYIYYNPKTKKESNTLAEAMIKTDEWDGDERKGVRSRETKSIVGIKMQVTYVTENNASKQEHQPTQYNTVEYLYDLELDSQHKIIGGEWYTESHPDFLWVADKFSFPETYGDSPNNHVDLNNISAEIKEAAKMNVRYELPVGAVVRKLFEASAQ